MHSCPLMIQIIRPDLRFVPTYLTGEPPEHLYNGVAGWAVVYTGEATKADLLSHTGIAMASV